MALPKNSLPALGVCLALLWSFPLHADVTFAVVLPLSGRMAAAGDEMRLGAEIGAEDVNAAGGVLGQKIVLQFHDDACDPTQAASLANKIVSQPPIGVIGHLCSATTLAAAPIYAEAGLPEITFSTNPKITQSGWKTIFRIAANDTIQAADLAAAMAKTFSKSSKIAVLDDKGAWGMGLANATADNLKQKGFAIALHDSINPGQKDFSALITRLKQESITDVLLGMYVMEAGLLVRQAHEQGFKGNFFGGDPLESPEFWHIAGSAAEGLRYSGVYDPSHTAAGKRLVAAFKKRGTPITAYSFYEYAAVQTFTQAIRRAASTKSEAIIAALHKETFDTMVGRISYDVTGEVKGAHYQIFLWKNGESVPIQ